MAAKISNPGTATFDGEREHGSYRLNPQILGVIEDIATGVEAGDAGLKSCAPEATAAAASGAKASEIVAAHDRALAIVDDIDECCDRIGQLLFEGYTFAEVAERVTLSGGATKLLALERWCDRVRLECDDPSDRSTLASLPWSSNALHARRQRGHRAMARLRATDLGRTHASVLHIVYGWRDPFVATLPVEVTTAIGRELVALARYTDVVETRRVEMARQEAARSTARSKATAAAAATKWRAGQFGEEKDDLGEVVLLPAQRGSEEARRAIRHGLQASHGGAMLDLIRHRERYEWALRVISSGDALRSAATPFHEPNVEPLDYEARPAFEARKRARDERRHQHDERADAFLLAVKLEADRMLRDASLAFREAWQASR